MRRKPSPYFMFYILRRKLYVLRRNLYISRRNLYNLRRKLKNSPLRKDFLNIPSCNFPLTKKKKFFFHSSQSFIFFISLHHRGLGYNKSVNEQKTTDEEI